MEKRINRLNPIPRPKARIVLKDRFPMAEIIKWNEFVEALAYLKEYKAKRISDVAKSANEPDKSILNKTEHSETPVENAHSAKPKTDEPDKSTEVQGVSNRSDKPKKKRLINNYKLADSDAELLINWKRWICGFISIWKRQTQLNHIAILSFESTCDKPSFRMEQAIDFYNTMERYRFDPTHCLDRPLPKWISGLLVLIEMIDDEGERCLRYLNFECPYSREIVYDYDYDDEGNYDGDADAPPQIIFDLLLPDEAYQKLKQSNKHISGCISLIEQMLPFEFKFLKPNVSIESNPDLWINDIVVLNHLEKVILKLLAEKEEPINRVNIEKLIESDRLLPDSAKGVSTIQKALQRLKNNMYVETYSRKSTLDPKGRFYKVASNWLEFAKKL